QAVTIRDESGRSTSTESRPDQPHNEGDTQSGRKQDADQRKATLQEGVYVYREAEGTVTMTEVVTGIQDDRYSEIRSGLEKGQQVVVSPFLAISKTLRDGSKVRVTERSELFSGQE